MKLRVTDPRHRAGCLTALALGVLLALPAQGEQVTLTPVGDNTVFQGQKTGGNPDNFEDNSCGAGTSVYAGKTDDGFRRRALLKFNVAAVIPAGAVITSATLTMRVTRVRDNVARSMTLRRATRDWGEGAVACTNGRGASALAGDATWIDARFQQVAWTTAGGDFGVVSATASVPATDNSNGIWNSTTGGNGGMVTDIQAWLNNASANYGWVLVGDETVSKTARQFASREAAVSVRPSLVINFTPPAQAFACCASAGTCTVATSGACTAGGGTPFTGQNTCSPNPCPQPAGACCNADESCTDAVTTTACTVAGGTFQGPASSCAVSQPNCGLPPFVDPLPIPAVLAPVGTRPDGAPKYQITVQPASQRLHRDLPATTNLWTYNGAYPSFTIEARVGQPIEVRYSNALPIGGHLLAVDRCADGPDAYGAAPRVVGHLHGGHVPARFDGQPEYAILPGQSDVYEYPNNQLPATLWYHDHALGITRLNVYAGMAGFYLLRDNFEDSLGLPSGQYEIPLAIQDRTFNPDGSLYYPAELVNMFTGDKVLVNGKVWPYLSVARGKYRFRLLNGSQGREYTLRLENTANPAQVIPFTLIGSDNGLISAPINLATVKMAPAERFDVIVDFSSFAAGTAIVLRNDDVTVPRVPNVMKFVVQSGTGFTGAIPVSLRPVSPIPELEAVRTRWFRLEQVSDTCAGNKWLVRTLNGPLGTPTGAQVWGDLSEFAQLGTTEIWEFENPSTMAHPMHIHLVSFQVLSRTQMNGTALPLEPHEINSWKDTVRVGPATRVRVIARFEDYPGRFPYHCHLLDHEDHEMMRQFQAVNAAASCDHNGRCEFREDSVSCGSDCAEVSGARCGNGLCEVGDGEGYLTCPADCNGQQLGQPGDFACGNAGTNPVGCGVDESDTRCVNATLGWACRAPARLRASCGDRLCEGAETVSNCALDCAVPVCVGTESPAEVSCGDGKDNDCDGQVDLADTECQPDSDSDGVPNALDNCTLVANGPLVPDAGGGSQRDSNGDGYGNLCDADLNNSGTVTTADFGILRSVLGQSAGSSATAAAADMNGSGTVTTADFGLLRARLGTAPGPSGLVP